MLLKVKEFIKKYGKMITIITVAFFILILFASAIAMLSEYKAEIAERSSAKANYYTLEARNKVERVIDEKVSISVALAYKISTCESESDLKELLFNVEANEEKGFLGVFQTRIIKDGVLYNSSLDNKNYNGVEFNVTDEVVLSFINDYHRAGYVGAFLDLSLAEGQQTVCGFYSPVEGSSLADGVAIYYNRMTITDELQEIIDDIKSEEAIFTVISNTKGVIFAANDDVDRYDLNSYIETKVSKKSIVDRFEKLLSQDKDGTLLCKVGLKDYLISVSADRSKIGDLAVVEYYSVDELYESSFNFVSTIIAVIIIFAILVLGVIVYLVLQSVKFKRKLFNLETTDVNLNCPNRRGFEVEAQRIIDRNITSNFYIIEISLRHYKYLVESFGNQEKDKVLNYLKYVTNKYVQDEETYGYLSEGSFLLLVHAKDRNVLTDKLKVHAFVCSKYKGSSTFNVLIKYGIYELDRKEKLSVSKMVDFANEANNTIAHEIVHKDGVQFNFYNDELRKVRMLNEDMELRMEGALASGEFQVFYQPKFNLNTNKQDGAEALVRWYDPKTGEYNRPALFMALFEANGFVTKLDRYVYLKVCEYISYSIAHGRNVFPVSVNISRVTAIQSDFVDYYTKLKKQYNVPDNLIMIEFTESFAYENYSTLAKIVKELHEHGFKCSIDDFGSGYSSYKILKSLPMDEIKLDKFFLDKGINDKRDKDIFESIIALGKALGMKVTQEGVEIESDVKILRELGVDVVQGYIYSHPIPLTDYINFVDRTSEHKI